MTAPIQPSREHGVRNDPELSCVQAHVDLIFLKASLHHAGIVSIIFGILTVALGAAGMNPGPVDAVLVLMGVLLLGEGIWLRVAPSPVGVVVDGIAFLVASVWVSE